MQIETFQEFPRKLGSISEVPGRLLDALRSHHVAANAPRLIAYTPAISVGDENLPASVLLVTDTGWLLASAEDLDAGDVIVEGSPFSETLFVELTSIVLWGELKIDFAATGTSYSATMRFNTVEEALFHEAIDLILDGIDRTHTKGEENRRVPEAVKDWPLKFRNEALDYLPKDQRLLAAVEWPAIVGGFRREIAPAGALLVTERELVIIADEKTPEGHQGELAKYGGIITYFPLARLDDFHVGRQDRFGILALQVHARHGGERLEFLFPVDHELAISEAMEQAGSARDPKEADSVAKA